MSEDYVKLLNLNNLENILIFNCPQNLQFLNSCFLNINNNINIVVKLTKPPNLIDEGFIQIFNLKKEKIKEIKNNNTKELTVYLDFYQYNNISYII